MNERAIRSLPSRPHSKTYTTSDGEVVINLARHRVIVRGESVHLIALVPGTDPGTGD